MSVTFMLIHILRIESFCINVNILYAHAVDTVAFMKVTTCVGLIYKKKQTNFETCQLTQVNDYHSSWREARFSRILVYPYKMLQYSISQNNRTPSW